MCVDPLVRATEFELWSQLLFVCRLGTRVLKYCRRRSLRDEAYYEKHKESCQKR